MFLGMLAFDRGLHDQFLSTYPPRSDEKREVDRFEPFMKNVVKPQLDQTLNTMFVHVPTPNRYNVGDLLRRFLGKCTTGYPG